jgi:hypothetical protein
MGIITQQRLWNEEYDIVLTFANPTEFGGQVYTSTYKKQPLPVYAIPVITVAPLNSLPRRMKTTFSFKKRRSLRDRTNIKALIKKGQLEATLKSRFGR